MHFIVEAGHSLVDEGVGLCSAEAGKKRLKQEMKIYLIVIRWFSYDVL